MSSRKQRLQEKMANERKNKEQAETNKGPVETQPEVLATEKPTEIEPTGNESEAAPVVEETQPPVNNFAVAADKIEQAGQEPVAPVTPVTTTSRGVIPDAFGNNVKGERICKNCGIKESETLAKNPRYSFCKGLCVNCYGKLERKSVKPDDMTPEQIQAKIKYYQDLLEKKIAENKPKDGEQGLPEGNATGSVNVTAEHVTIETHGANVDVKADELAIVEAE